MSVLFLPVTKEDLAVYALEGLPVAEHGVDSLRAAARAAHLPDAVLDDEATLRPLLAALLVAGGAERLDRRSKGPGEAVSSALPDWLDLRPEARNYLLLVVRREREVTRTTADAANLLNKAEVVESYQVHGNRWTMRPDGRERHPALKKAMALEPASEAASTAEWLNHLGNAIEAPQLGRPWYRSTFVLLILAFAVLFVLVHLLLLARALSKVHASDPALLLLPVKAFGGAAAVGLFAVSIHKLSGGGGAS